MRFLFTCLSTQLVVQRLRWASHFHCHEKQITQSVQLVISTYKRCKITFNYINTCILLKNIPYSLNLCETSSGTRVVYFLLYPVTTGWWCHVPLFRGILRAQSVNYAVGWMYDFFPRVKRIFYPSKITFVSLLRRVISSLYLTPINGVFESRFWFSWDFVEVLSSTSSSTTVRVVCDVNVTPQQTTADAVISSPRRRPRYN